jgi:hypothetical protein
VLPVQVLAALAPMLLAANAASQSLQSTSVRLLADSALLFRHSQAAAAVAPWRYL